MDITKTEKSEGIFEPATQSKIVDFINQQNRRVEKQLANCMKEIQQLMALKKHKLPRLDTIKVSY